MAVPAYRVRPRPSGRPGVSSPHRPPLEAVRPKAGRSRTARQRRAIVVLSIFIVMGSLLAVAGARAYLTQGQVQLAHLQGQLTYQVGQYRDLELKVAKLEQPANVLSEAQAQGLVVPTKVEDLPQVNLSTPTTESGAHAPSVRR